jgi:hypothetical protein
VEKQPFTGGFRFCMLIKLRNEFYQVQCDAFGDLATDLLDIRPKILRAMSPDEKSQQTQTPGFTEMKRVFRVDIHRRCRNI